MVFLQYAFLISFIPICYILWFNACLFWVQPIDIYHNGLGSWINGIATLITSYTIAMQGFVTSLMQSPFSYTTELPRSARNEHELDIHELSSNSSSSGRRSPELVSKNSQQPSRTKTIYHIAHPAPVAHRRPKLVLQFLVGSNHVRPVPAFNVIPARVLTIARRSPKTLRRKTGLMENDLVVFRAEDYMTVENDVSRLTSDSNEQDSKISGDPLGVICPTTGAPFQNTVTEININDNSTWQGGLLTNGNYEFVMVNSSVQIGTVRWIPQRPSSKKSKSDFQHDTSGNYQRNRFTFCYIDPEVRKHPVLGILDNNTQTLKIYDQYNACSVLFDSTHSVPVSTTERLRSLIILTGTWVALNEGWSSLYTSMTVEPGSRLSIGGQTLSQLPVQNPDWLTPPQNITLGSRLTSSSRAPSSLATPSSSIKAAISRLESKLNPLSTQNLKPFDGKPLEDTPGCVMSASQGFRDRHVNSHSQGQGLSAISLSGELTNRSSMEKTPREVPTRLHVYQTTNGSMPSASFNERYTFKGLQRDHHTRTLESGNKIHTVETGLVSDTGQVEVKYTSALACKIREKLRSLRTKIHNNVRRIR